MTNTDVHGWYLGTFLLLKYSIIPQLYLVLLHLYFTREKGMEEAEMRRRSGCKDRLYHSS
jgi:hypothetical protein